MRLGSLTRAGAALLALAVIVVVVGLDRREDGCTEAVKEMFLALDARAPAQELDARIEDIEDSCDGSTRLVDSARVLFEKGHSPRAARLLREAVEREPENFDGWAAISVVLARADPAAARAAAERARELNSRYRPEL